jgi:hypothetical protein
MASGQGKGRLSFSSSPYLRLRLALLRRTLANLRERLGASLLLLLGVAGPVAIGLAAAVALPPLYAATLAPIPALAVLAGHVALLAAPLFWIRSELLPSALLAWQAGVPLSRRELFCADALVIARLFFPGYLLHALSAGLWLWQSPSWLTAVLVTALVNVIAVLSMATALGIAVLFFHRNSGSGASPLWRLRGSRRVFVCHALLWRPVLMLNWRSLSLWFFASAAATTLWLGRFSVLPREALAFACCALLMKLTLGLDAKLSSHLGNLRGLGFAWPLAWNKLELAAKMSALLPAWIFSLICLAPFASARSRGGSELFAVASAVSHSALCFATRPGSRARAAAGVSFAAFLGVFASLVGEI